MSIRLSAVGAFAVLALVCPASARARGTQRANVVEAKFALRHQVVRDDAFSLLRFRGFEGQGGLGYERRWDRHRLGLAGAFNMGRLRTDTKRFPSRASQLDLELHYLVRAKLRRDTRQRHRLWLGAAVTSTNWLLNFNDYQNFTWATSQALSFRAEYQRRFGKRHGVVLGLRYPMIAWVGRPPYAGFDAAASDVQERPLQLLRDGEVRSVHNFVNPTGQLGYRLTLDKVTEIDIRYEVQYLWVAGQTQVRSLSNTAAMALRLRF